MRKLSLVLVAAMLLSAGSAFAGSFEKPKPSKNLSAQIAEILEASQIKVKDADLTARVLFTLNEENEIIVLKVDSDDPRLEQIIKSKLNYKKVDLKEKQSEKKYVIPVRITV